MSKYLRVMCTLRLELLRTWYLDCSITTRTDDVVCICCEYGIIYKRCMSTELLQSLPRLEAMHSAKIRKYSKFRKEKLSTELLNTNGKIHKWRNFMCSSIVSQVGERYRISNSEFFQEGNDVLNKRTVYLFKIAVTLKPKRLRYSEYSIHPKP